MTTIATDGKSMAGDGRACRSGTIISDKNIKVKRLNDGRLIGTAGDSADAIAVIDWLNGGEKPKLGGEHFGALVLSPDGTCFYYHEPDLIPIASELPMAIGSGTELALAAMDAGMTPVRAVQIACRRDPWPGGDITVEYIE